jgi:hypothetical protein
MEFQLVFTSVLLPLKTKKKNPSKHILVHVFIKKEYEKIIRELNRNLSKSKTLVLLET